MVVFSHQFVSQQFNQNNQQKFNQIQQQSWHLNWPLLAKSELVDSFVADWQVVDGGISANVAKPELSLQMGGALIKPKIQQELKIKLMVSQAMEAKGTFKLEFSDQLQQIYYLSDELQVSDLRHVIDLNALRWKIVGHNAADLEGEFITWSNIQVLDALVIRFYFPEATELKLGGIELNQTQENQWSNKPQVNCQSVALSAKTCLVTNQMRYLDIQQNRSVSNQLISFQIISGLPALTWLLLAAGLMILTWLLRFDFNQVTVFGFVGIFIGIGLIHHNWVTVYLNYIRWPLLLLMLGLLWQQRQYIKWPSNPARPVWVFTGIIILLLIGLNPSAIKFQLLSDIPQYLLWAWVQQLLIGPWVSGYLFRQLNVSKGSVAWIVAVLFSGIHAPNHVLMVATLLGGFAWSYAWLKYQNMYANAFSHALLALVFYQVMPDAWLGSARIGVFF